MAVYVDAVRIGFTRYKGGRQMRMSHMVADTPDELHDLASRIGLRRDWFQAKASAPHYDVAEGKRQQAIRLGAREVTDRAEFVAIVRRIRTSEAWLRWRLSCAR